ncbi:MAG: FAD-dependent monooxygenase [Kutzneria sp.]|nr:FAD-dependent monooxygenase [Kutzneria sp.]
MGGVEPSTVSVLGDAIHAMSSALGIVANTALRDVHVLGHELLAAAGGDRPVVEGIGPYEEQMRDYGFTAVRLSAAVGEKVLGHRPRPEHPALILDGLGGIGPDIELDRAVTSSWTLHARP